MIELEFEDKFFQDIKNRKKTTIGKIEAELSGIEKGDLVIFKDIGKNENNITKIIAEVKDIHKFNDVTTMLKEMKLKTILPRTKSYKDGEKVFEETYGNRLKDAKFIAFTFDIQSITGPIIKNKKNSDVSGPRIKNKKNDVSGPRIKNKKNDENDDVSGPRIKNKKNSDENDDVSGPRIKNKKNNDVSGPRIKNKKNSDENDENDDVFGPRIKNKKNNDVSGPRIKNKKNDDNIINFSNLENVDLPNNANRPNREFKITISEPWFSLIENGQKQVEGRLFKGIFTELRVNDTIRFINRWNGKEKSVTVKITKLSKYPNFGDLLFHEKLHRVLPGLPNIKCGILVYNKIYSSFNEVKQHGTIAIEVKVI
jgi:ASC-1-like (ASCH) protein